MAPQRRLAKIVDRVVDASLALAVLVPSVAIFLQVFYRYVLNDPTAWLDEFSVLVFAWLTMIGAAATQRTDSHMSIDIFARLLPRRIQLAVWILRVTAIAAVTVILFWYGLELTRRMSFIEYPAMEISRGFLFAILPVCMPLILYYLVRTAWTDLQIIRSGGKVFEHRVDGPVA
jgi:TRAP-type C4-dicarboxylate transport system permease small subunit